MRETRREAAKACETFLLAHPVLKITQLADVLKHHNPAVETAAVELEHRNRQNDPPWRIGERAGFGIDRVDRQLAAPFLGQVDQAPQTETDQRPRFSAEDSGGLPIGRKDVGGSIADQNCRGRRLDNPLGIGVKDPILFGLAPEVVQISRAFQGERCLGGKCGDHFFALRSEGENTAT